jgi:phospho-N-acetylmuramoyl-pentapeptide-transferase
MIGFVDDYLIAVKKNNDGLTPIQKFADAADPGWQCSSLPSIVRMHSLRSALPFVSQPFNLGWGYFILVLLMFAGSSNAVNLTDGMDGLAWRCSIIALIPYTVICILQKRIGLSIFDLLSDWCTAWISLLQ